MLNRTVRGGGVIGTPRGQEGDDRGVTNGLFQATFCPAAVLHNCLCTVHPRLRETYRWNGVQNSHFEALKEELT
jgi:hypothetical protein